MAKKTQAIGLDIGGTAVRAAEVTTGSNGNAELLRYEEVPLPANAVRDGEVVDKRAVVAALKALWSRGGFSSKDVILGVGNQQVAVRPLTMPRLPMDQLQAALPFQVQDSLAIPVDDAVLGFYPTAEVINASGPALEGMLVASSRDTVMNNLLAVEAAGLRPVVIDLSAFALLRSMARGPHASGTVALIDIGARITTVVVATDGSPRFVRALATGAQDLSDALARSLGISLEEAERGVHTYGLNAAGAPDNASAAGPFNDAVNVLVDGVRNSIGFYASNHADAPATLLVLSGGGSSVPGLGQALASATRTRTLLGNPLEGVAIARRLKGLETMQGREATMAMPVGLGLGLAA